MDELFHVMDVLAKRRKAQSEGKTPEKVLAFFKRSYYTEIENDLSSVSANVFVNHKRGKAS